MIEKTVDSMLGAVRDALIAAARSDYKQAQAAGITEEEIARIVVADSIRLILEAAELLRV